MPAHPHTPPLSWYEQTVIGVQAVCDPRSIAKWWEGRGRGTVAFRIEAALRFLGRADVIELRKAHVDALRARGGAK